MFNSSCLSTFVTITITDEQPPSTKIKWIAYSSLSWEQTCFKSQEYLAKFFFFFFIYFIFLPVVMVKTTGKSTRIPSEWLMWEYYYPSGKRIVAVEKKFPKDATLARWQDGGNQNSFAGVCRATSSLHQLKIWLTVHSTFTFCINQSLYIIKFISLPWTSWSLSASFTCWDSQN